MPDYTGDGGPGGGDAMRALLASYYGLADDEPTGAKHGDEIDAADFDADSYVKRLLREEVGGSVMPGSRSRTLEFPRVTPQRGILLSVLSFLIGLSGRITRFTYAPRVVLLRVWSASSTRTTSWCRT
jgi:hypothetical protein